MHKSAHFHIDGSGFIGNRKSDPKIITKSKTDL